MKSAPLLMLASELQESCVNFDFTLPSYCSVKGKSHSFDGKAFYLSVVLVPGFVLNNCIYVCVFSIPFGRICSGNRT